MQKLFSRKWKNLMGLHDQSQQLNVRTLTERERIRECSSGLWWGNLEVDRWLCGEMLVKWTLSDGELSCQPGGGHRRHCNFPPSISLFIISFLLRPPSNKLKCIENFTLNLVDTLVSASLIYFLLLTFLYPVPPEDCRTLTQIMWKWKYQCSHWPVKQQILFPQVVLFF